MECHSISLRLSDLFQPHASQLSSVTVILLHVFPLQSQLTDCFYNRIFKKFFWGT